VFHPEDLPLRVGTKKSLEDEPFERSEVSGNFTE